MGSIKLVDKEDVAVEKETIENGLHIIEFKPDDHVANILMRGHRNMANMFDNLGFKGFEFVHPRYGHKVNFFAKGDIVMMIDYHGLSTMVIEVMNEEETEWFMETIGEQLGPEELKNIKELGR